MTGGACTHSLPTPQGGPESRLPSAPFKVSENRVTRITVCTRPFRPAGPRLEAERMGEKIVIHNYGHGGSGWSLSWGCAEEAVGLAQATSATDFAVIGAGVIGLTTALRLVQTGARVTIYAKDLPREARSSRATGVWSPSSRIGLQSAAPDGFKKRWESWARSSYQTHQQFIGSVGHPSEFVPFYQLSGGEPHNRPPEQHDFLHLGARIRDLGPSDRAITQSAHPFPVPSVRRGEELIFNIAAYTDRLVRDFFALGGKIERRVFGTRNDVLSLSHAAIVNCTGYGAKALWGADELVPVRGQINWLPPQPEARYGLMYKQAYVLSRRDGLILQNIGTNEDFGYGIEDEAADRAEMRATLKTVAPLFQGWT